MKSILSLLPFAAALSAAPFTHDPKIAEELRARGGLPNFFAKLEAGGPVRIAYLGGSITAANGWRPKTFAWFKTNFPKAELIEINAAISGTGSDYGACRVAGDVLSRNPDLVFMEHRVNGGGGYEARSVEGIIRQIWKKDAKTDICLVYTINQPMLAPIQSGSNTSFGAVMETAANAYGIPSIDLGVEIARLEKSGALIFKAPGPVEGKIVFAADGTHPGDAGHEIYRDVIARSMLAMKKAGTPGPHALIPPLDPLCWESAALVPASNLARSAGWTAVDTEKDGVYRDDFGRTHAMLRGAVKCEKAGETITVRWHGTTIGFSDIPQAPGSVVEVSVDGAAPLVIKRVQTESKKKYARFHYLPALPSGEHRAVLTVKEIPEGQAVYCGHVLVIGAPLP